MLNVGEDIVRRWYEQARTVMAIDAVKRQAQFKFGSDTTATACIEADESCFGKWSEIDEETGERVYKWYVWLGVVQRGNLESLWLTPVGVTESRGEPRVPPLSCETWSSVVAEIFDKDTNAVLMTDSAAAYREVGGPADGVVEKHAVNHSDHEWARSIDVLKDVDSGRRGPAMAGTQLLDHEWSLLKRELPVTGVSIRTEGGLARMESYIRAAQWKRLAST